MNKLFVGLAACVVVVGIACGGSTADVGPGSGTGDGGGGTGDGGGGGNGDGGGGTDGGGATDANGGGDITNPNAPEVALTFGTCPTFAACGGSLPGVWTYASGCIADPATQMKQLCAGVVGSNYKGSVKGTIGFTAANVARSVTVKFSGTFLFPQSCTNLAGGCPGIQSGLKNFFDTATCADGPAQGSCLCDVATTKSDTGGDTYTVTGNTITTGMGQKYDYCVQGGNQLTYKELPTSGGQSLDGVFGLTK